MRTKLIFLVAWIWTRLLIWKAFFSEVSRDAIGGAYSELVFLAPYSPLKTKLKLPENVIYRIYVIRGYVLILWWCTVLPIKEFWCKRKGHTWIDYSYGNPDHGCFYMECQRCGREIYERLY